MDKDNIFSDVEKDVIGEVMNISLGSSATSLSTLLGKRVEITVPKVNVVSAAEFSIESLEPAIAAEISYIEGLNGINVMVLKKGDARVIIEILMGQDIPEEEFRMDEINTSAICEVMNQMMGSAATALSDFLGRPINISTPVAYEIENGNDFKSKYFVDEDYIVAVSFNLTIEDKVHSEFVNIMPMELSREIVSIFLKGTEGASEEAASAEEDSKGGQEESEEIPVIQEKENEENEDQKEYVEQQEHVEHVEKKKPVKKAVKKSAVKKVEQGSVNIKPAEFESFDDYDDEESLSQEQMSNLELIMSVPLEISVEIGKTKRKIKEILEFSQGTIIELDKQAGALVDIIVNGQLIAKGEVVVVNDNFGVRVSEIIKKDEIMNITTLQ